MNPIQYLPPVNQQDFLRSALGGLEVGSAFAANAQRQAKQEAAAQAAAQYQADTDAAMANPTPKAFLDLTLKYPQHREAYKLASEQLNAGQLKSEISDATTLAAALQSGRPDVALGQLETRIAKMQEAGQDPGPLTLIRDLVKQDPKQAYGATLSILSGLPGGDKVVESLGKLEIRPFTVRKAEAEAGKEEALAAKAGEDAKTAAVTAKYAESNALKDLEERGWRIDALKADIDFKKQSARIAALNASLAKEQNDLKREELLIKRDEALRVRDEKVREKAAMAEAEVGAIDNGLNTIDRFLSMAQDPKTKKPSSTLRAAAGPIDSRLPTFQTDVANLEGFITSMKSQAFLTAVRQAGSMSGMTEKEGDKLESAILNLDLRQGAQQVLDNIAETQRIFLKSRKAAEKKYGVAPSIPDTPAAKTTTEDIDSLVRRYSGGG